MKQDATTLFRPEDNEAKHFSGIYQFYYNPLLFLAFLAASWFTSYSGVVAMAEWGSDPSETTRQLALLVTASAMGALYALWHYAMRLIPRYVTYRARGIGINVVILLMAMLALSSTYTSFIGLSQESARSLELRDQADAYAQKKSLLAPRAAAMQDALFVISPQATAACARYEKELNTGEITGARGKGVVTGSLLRLCTAKTKIAGALEGTIAANREILGELSSLSARLDDVILERKKDIGAREREFFRLARAMDALFQELQDADRTKGLRAASDDMAGSVAELEGATDALGQAQAQAIAQIITEERSSGNAISGLIKEIEAMPVPPAGRATPTPPQELVLKHWQMHLPQLALALAIDLFAPLSTLLFWAAAIKARARKLPTDNGDAK